MSELKKLELEFERKKQELQGNCPHKHIKKFLMIPGSYCLRCGKLFRPKEGNERGIVT